MNQSAHQAIAAMLNSFPQGGQDTKLLMMTYSAMLDNVSDRAISETCKRFVCGEIEGQSRTFAPAAAEFIQEARRIEKLVPYMDRPRLAPSQRAYDRYQEPTPESRIRMGFKMSVLSAGLGMGRVDEVAEANRKGLEALIALGHRWGVPVPEQLLEQVAA